MDGPYEPGYYPSVTGVRSAGELRAIYGQVHRYGPEQAKKSHLARVILSLRKRPEIKRVWRGPEHPIPHEELSYDEVRGLCMREARVEAQRLTGLDPHARGAST